MLFFELQEDAPLQGMNLDLACRRLSSLEIKMEMAAM